jgi:hypothetical protein
MIMAGCNTELIAQISQLSPDAIEKLRKES